MSVLVHLCRSCEHQQGWHSARCPGYTSCRCCRAQACDPDPEPVLLRTFSFPGWRPEPVVEPGTVRNPHSMHASQSCSCAACGAAYLRLTAVAEPA